MSARAYRVRVTVRLDGAVNDPQGNTVRDALRSLGHADVRDVRVGKVIDLDARRRRRRRGPRREPSGCATSCSPTRSSRPVRDRGARGSLMRAAVVVFPGSNCDRDTARPCSGTSCGIRADLVWHRDTDLAGLRRSSSCRAASATATTCAPVPSPRARPSWRAVRRAARRGVPGAGHLQRLPGAARGRPAARRHAAQRRASSFRCEWVHVRVERRDTPFTSAASPGAQVLRLPIAHGDGNYHAPPGPAGPARGRGAHRLPLLRCRRAHVAPGGQPQRLGGRHRRHLRTSSATSWASCPTPSGPRRPTWAARTARSSGRPCSDRGAHERPWARPDEPTADARAPPTCRPRRAADARWPTRGCARSP